MILGVDFDNTIIRYDDLFHRVAKEEELITDAISKEKNAVRDHLRSNGQEEKWTRLQGVVYGRRIIEAEPFYGMRDTLRLISAKGFPIYIISHKTRIPYLGDPCDLHQAALNWLSIQGFHSGPNPICKRNNIIFEETKTGKINRIISQGCTHYVDDLPEILEALPSYITKILFAPYNKSINCPSEDCITMRNWTELPSILGIKNA